jgi:predicted secreted protein
MGWVSGFTVYVVLWWAVLYMVMPWGSKPPENPAPGHATSAPEKPRFRLKFIVITIISGVLWLLLDWVIRMDIYSFSGK